ncbi:hypothetical protein A2592_02895 [Candidatus Kaiserbacteria bacterium RIFOXYD1_FULL_42_15]|uniref:Uncharacterized protein n=1 Tax=Candidatus Kaiserbacteria bacterium RIFOXYD1_FULL_42_15 TaxID=1798532 RepID=A0A1F6FS63_9BACT|nr:MAG: hypothetical protein A2592_02895 [Candidatus Kaiserbacteria bacterium RIFOXYD1_FULL_42_15]
MLSNLLLNSERTEIAYAARLLLERLKQVPPQKGKGPKAELRKKLEAEAARVARELAELISSG